MGTSRDTIAAVAVFHASVFALFQAWCPEAYMDETLHVPQAQRYCRGDVTTWDPKITTLPGTYAISAATLAPLQLILGPEPCSTGALRGVNALLLGPLTAVIAAGLLHDVHGKGAGGDLVIKLRLLRIGFMPLHFFFCFMYYTDVASTSLVLLMYWLHRRQRFGMSAAVGAAAVFVRQTNIVWVWGLAVHIFVGSGGGVGQWISRLFTNLRNGVLLPHAAVGVAFAAFVLWNKGLAVGDRSNHVVMVHSAMLLYLGCFILFFLGPVAWLDLLTRLRGVRFPALLLGTCVAVSCAAMATYGSFAHPFILADNRHITFYLWKDLLRRTYVRVTLIPVALGICAAALWAPGRRLASCSGVELGLWALCCAMVVVPTPLLEFRYFVVPTMLALVHQPVRSVREESAALLVACLINVAFVSVFLFRPFRSVAWNFEPQRFMW